MNYVCTTCGTGSNGETITPGYFILEVLLWCLCLLPGLLYSVWRLSSRYKGCPACGAKGIVPVTSPVGQQMLHDHDNFWESDD